MVPLFYDSAAVERLLDFPGCIEEMRRAMTALSAVDGVQPLRQIIDLGENRLFGVMPGRYLYSGSFGAKLVSVFHDSSQCGRSRHQGVVVVYEAGTGAIECIVDAEEITRIRTACASAASTEALARTDSEVLAVLGTGTQGEAHIRALVHVRPFKKILLWGRSPASAKDLAARMARDLGIDVEAVSSAEAAARGADVICTVSSSMEPILFGEWVRPGTHINIVGSSFLGPVEVDSALVAAGRYIADYRPSVLAQAGELDVARTAGIVGDDHVVGEIGEVFAGRLEGRQRSDQITLYKSLGNVIQDLAAAKYVHEKSRRSEGELR